MIHICSYFRVQENAYVLAVSVSFVIPRTENLKAKVTISDRTALNVRFFFDLFGNVVQNFHLRLFAIRISQYFA